MNESFGCAANEESNIVFGFLDKFFYENFWKWLDVEKGIHVSNHIKERTTDIDYPYSDTMLDKVYDITGYLCGARLHNVIRLNRLKSMRRSSIRTRCVSSSKGSSVG